LLAEVLKRNGSATCADPFLFWELIVIATCAEMLYQQMNI
jgi:hypothetical protein